MDGRAFTCLAASNGDPRGSASAGELEQGLVVTLEHGEGGAALAKAQGQTPGMRDDAGGDADDFLHHGLQAPPLGGVANRAVGLDQGRLADGAQNVEGQHGQGQHQIVGGEFARRQALQVEIDL